jgi:hypothetical protein
MSASTKISRHWQLVRQNVSEIINHSAKETHLPNPFIYLPPEHLSVTDLETLVIELTCSQKHVDATKIVLKSEVVKKKPKTDVYDADADINAMIALFLCLVGIIVVLGSVFGYLILWDPRNPKKDNTPCIDSVIGDGVCDDRQNVLECNYDGQDCCLEGLMNTTFCEDCLCHLGKCS